MDSDGSRILLFGAIIVFLMLVKSYYSAVFYAVQAVNEGKIKALVTRGKKYSSLNKILANQHKLNLCYSVFNGFSYVVITICSAMGFVGITKELLNSLWGQLPYVNSAIAMIGVALLTGIVTVGLTDIIPSRFAEIKSDEFALNSVLLLRIMFALMTPIVFITDGLAFLISKLLRIPHHKKKDIITEEEILMMVDEGNESGVIEESQREMINNIFEFGDVTVGEVMTHRTDIVAVDINSKISDIVYLAINKGFSRIPVYENSVDSITGLIFVKDLLCLIGCDHTEDFKLSQFMREAIYFPETIKCDEALEKLTSNKQHLAVVVDEYGGTAGIVCMEDLLEEIVGNIQDEYDEEEKEIEKLEDGVYLIEGSVDPEDIAKYLRISMPDEHNYDTMSAFIVDLLGRIPEEGETPSVTYENVNFTVLLVEDNWIKKIKATKN